jgi:hypothetical protein
VTGEVVIVNAPTPEEAAKYKGQLKGKIVFAKGPVEVTLDTEADTRRYSEAQLDETAQAPDPARAPGARPAGDPRGREEARQNRVKLARFYRDEGVLAVVTASARGGEGTIFTMPAGSRDAKDPVPPVTFALTVEHYNRIARLVERKIPVKVEFDVRARFHEDADGVNVIADLKGARKQDELVMIGAHLDSWHAGTGAVDNAAGCAVMMEVMRILTALNLKLDRTVRIALWDAEEQGLVGSREYVKAHFADRATMERRKEHDKLSGYFNYDNGSGKIRGVYLQGNDMMRPIFESWFAPLKDLGVTTVSIRNTSGTDHLSFDAVGLPGFQFIQDPLDYGSRRHHSNMDVYEAVQKGDLMQASAVIASVVYHAATRAEMLPRKPLPKPEGKPDGGR